MTGALAGYPAQLWDHAWMAEEPGPDHHASGVGASGGLTRAGQVSLVTGGSAGLGLAIARALADAGSDIVLASRSAERCQQAAARLSAATRRRVQGRACDVTDERAVANLVETILADHRRLDVLVTSAGIQARGTLDQLDVQTLRACLEVNVVGTWLACRAAALPMRAAGYGRILTLASALGLVGAAARSGYAASKSAVVQLTRSLAVELARRRRLDRPLKVPAPGRPLAYAAQPAGPANGVRRNPDLCAARHHARQQGPVPDRR